MEITLEPLFIEKFKKCPLGFQEQFRKAHQMLKIADHPLDIKDVKHSIGNTKLFKLNIDASRIAINYDGKKEKIVCFLFNQFRLGFK
jgi:mRNA-degrading endonuclease RelE of RelBE toxin-antitoxin system